MKNNSNVDTTIIKYLKRFFILPVPLVLLLSFISFPFVVYCLANPDLKVYVLFSSYILSAYSLTVLCIRFPYMYRRSKELIKGDELGIVVFIRRVLEKFKFTRLYLYDVEFRALVALHLGFLINAVYASFRLYDGINVKSVWFIAIGVYYLLFGIIRYLLIRRFGKNKQIANSSAETLHQIKTYKATGILMLMLNVAMAGMIIQMVVANQTVATYSAYTVVLSAVYTFYITALAINNVIKFRKDKNIILSASKNLSFVGALMSLFTLQTAMLHIFGTTETNIQLMNSITGGIVTGIALSVALFMIMNSNRKLKKIT